VCGCVTVDVGDARCRRVGRRVGVHSGHYLNGTLLRHLSPADVAALADATPRLPHHLRRLARLRRRHDSHRHLPASASHAVRRTQVRRDVGRPLPGKGILSPIVDRSQFLYSQPTLAGNKDQSKQAEWARAGRLDVVDSCNACIDWSTVKDVGLQLGDMSATKCRRRFYDVGDKCWIICMTITSNGVS